MAPLSYVGQIVSYEVLELTLGKTNSKGNALFLILIGVALFAALSYAITSSDRGSGGIAKEQGRLDAGELQQRLTMIKVAYEKLRLQGCAFNQISVHWDQDNDGDYNDNNAGELYYNSSAPVDHSCHIFHPQGGGIEKPVLRPSLLQVYKTGWNITAQYGHVYFTTFNRLGGIGLDAERDLVGIVYGMPLDTCLAYNSILSIANSGTAPPTGRLYPDLGGAFKGNISTYGAGSHTTPGLPMYGQETGCVIGNAGNYHAFIVLQAR
jgi:hypothetical protein